jgi:hypothetical protein
MLEPWLRSSTLKPIRTSLKPVNNFRRGNQLDGKHCGEFKWYQAHRDQQLTTHAATDDRCANFSASTRPTQNLKLLTNSTADKLPLEKFHRLLDLVFRGKFLKFDSISCFVFLWDVYRVSLDPVVLCGPAAHLWRGRGDVPRLAVPPAHDYRSLNFGNDLLSTVSTVSTLSTLSTVSYSVIPKPIKPIRLAAR